LEQRKQEEKNERKKERDNNKIEGIKIKNKGKETKESHIITVNRYLYSFCTAIPGVLAT
jgi:hypothetical protein